jgi:transcriptional regulator with XRE-family HTH domain
MTLIREYVGETLKDIRKQNAMSLRSLSKRTHISLAYLSEIEHGKKEMSSELFNAWAKGMGFTTEDLFYLIAKNAVHTVDARKESA